MQKNKRFDTVGTVGSTRNGKKVGGKSMELQQLEYFAVAAREENITYASEILHIAQPALSQSIRRLEDELGVKVFDRRGKRIKLNDVGRELLRTLDPILAELDSLPDRLQAIAEETEETISLNVLVASHIVTHMMIDYRKIRPKANFKVGRSADAADWDIRLSAVSGQGGSVPRAAVKLFEEEIVLAVPASSAYAERSEIKLREVSNEAFLTFPENMPYHSLCSRMWSEAGITPRISLESDNPQSLKELIATGMGVALWPQYSWGGADEKKIRLLHITEPKTSRIVTISANPKRKLSDAAEEFLKFSLEYFRK